MIYTRSVFSFFILCCTAFGPPPLFAGETAPPPVDYPPGIVSPPPHFPVIANLKDYEILPDTGLQIGTLIFQCPFENDPFLLDMLRAVNKHIVVTIIVNNKSGAQKLEENIRKSNLGHKMKQVRFVTMPPSNYITRWGRDPFLVLHNRKKNHFLLIDSIKPQARRYPGFIDKTVMETLLRTDNGPNILGRGEIAVVDTWNVTGGAVTVDDQNAYVGEGTILESQGWEGDKPRYTRKEVLDSMTAVFKKNLVVMPLLGNHNDRYHIPVGKTRFGKRTSLLSDPVQALLLIKSMTKAEREEAIDTILRSRSAWLEMSHPLGKRTVDPDEKKLSRKKLEEFFNVTDEKVERLKRSIEVWMLNETEKMLKKKGVAVVRIPNLQSVYRLNSESDPKTTGLIFPFGLLYTNIVQDSRGSEETAFVPKFGIKKLDDRALDVYRSLDKFDNIYQIQSLDEAVDNGGPRCRVQVIGKPIYPNILNRIGGKAMKKIKKFAKRRAIPRVF